MNNSIQLNGDSNSNLIIKRIKIFKPKHSNIGEINNKSKDKVPIFIKNNKPNICNNNNEITIQKIINYFGLYVNVDQLKK